MFNSNNSSNSNSKPQKGNDVTTIIARGVSFRGDVQFVGSLHVEGNVTGTVTADGESNALLTLNAGGRIEGEVSVPNAVIDGEVAGNIHCSNRLELAPDARIEGDVHYKVLELAAGATINGRMVHEDGEPARLAHLRDDAQARGADDDADADQDADAQWAGS